VTPLTVECARVRQLLPEYHDGELAEAERAHVARHVEACEACATRLASLTDALDALGTLSGGDLARLRGELPAPLAAEVGELDTRPLSRLVAVSLVLLFALIGLAAALQGPAAEPTDAAAPSPAAEAPEPPDFPLPVVGADVGIEEDPELLAAMTARPAPEPPPVVEVADPEPEPEPAPAREPEPSPEPEPAPEPDIVVVADQPDPQPSPADDGPPPLPDDVQALVERLQLSDGLAFQEVVLFFVRDPEGRDRLGRNRATVEPVVRETSPSDPAALTLRPPRGRTSWDLLVGQLLDGPFGLRVVTRAQRIRGRTTVDVHPIAYHGVETDARGPVLKGPLLMNAAARRALVMGEPAEAVAQFLGALNDPSLLEFRRLKDESARLEAEADQLERRLRALLGSVRGLRGLAVSIRGEPRSIDVFPSARRLSEAFPRLLRSVLLEAALENEERDLEEVFGDLEAQNIREGVLTTRDAHRKLLDAFATCRQDAADDAVYATTAGARAVLVVRADDELMHGIATPK